MLKKPADCLLNDETWKSIAWQKRLDIRVSSWMPRWIINLVVAMAFALFCAAVVTGVLAFAAWDLSWFWGATSRSLFGGFTLLFCLILAKD